MRVYNPTSSLLRVEIPVLKGLLGVKIKWHALVGEDNAIKEIDAAAKAVDDASFDDEQQAVESLKKFLSDNRLYDTIAAKEMGVVAEVDGSNNEPATATAHESSAGSSRSS